MLANNKKGIALGCFEKSDTWAGEWEKKHKDSRPSVLNVLNAVIFLHFHSQDAAKRARCEHYGQNKSF